MKKVYTLGVWVCSIGVGYIAASLASHWIGRDETTAIVAIIVLTAAAFWCMEKRDRA